MLQVNIEIVSYYGQKRTGYGREENLWFGDLVGSGAMV